MTTPQVMQMKQDIKCLHQQQQNRETKKAPTSSTTMLNQIPITFKINKFL
uniref:Uncharacterized protein n=1 Tax=Arundo donax TaxID=35708 RepID=A0A0A9DWG5_ARUDO